MTPTPCKRKDTQPNFFEKSLISALAQIFSAASFVCEAGSRLPFTSFFKSKASFMCIRQSSPAAIAKELGNCFVLQHLIRQLPDREQQQAKSIMRKIFSPGRLI